MPQECTDWSPVALIRSSAVLAGCEMPWQMQLRCIRQGEGVLEVGVTHAWALLEHVQAWEYWTPNTASVTPIRPRGKGETSGGGVPCVGAPVLRSNWIGTSCSPHY